MFATTAMTEMNNLTNILVGLALSEDASGQLCEHLKVPCRENYSFIYLFILHLLL